MRSHEGEAAKATPRRRSHEGGGRPWQAVGRRHISRGGEGNLLRPLRATGIIVSILALAVAAVPALAQGGHEEEIVLESDTDYELAASAVDEQAMRQLVSDLQDLGSRVTGYPGCHEAARMVADGFREIGIEDVTIQEFPVVVPIAEPDDHGYPASLSVEGGDSFEMLPMWPNLVRTSKTPVSYTHLTLPTN